MRIGLVPMSAKPYHAGHDGLVRMAAQENDKVRVFVSLADRVRPNEVPISGADMSAIWKGYIEPTLPNNVSVEYVANPVRAAYEALGQANEKATEDEFAIYSDPTDLAQNFPEKSLQKYAGDIYGNNQIIPRAVQRTETVDVSGTKMRKFLETGDKESFIRNLPRTVDGDAVWDILSKGARPKASPKPTAKKAVAKKATRKESVELIRRFVLEAVRN